MMREAHVRVPHEAFDEVGLGEFVSLCTAAGLRDVSEIECDGPGCLLVVEFESGLDEDAVSALDVVEWWERLGGADASVTYLVRLSGTDIDGSFCDSRIVSSTDVQTDGDGLSLSLVGFQDDLAEQIAEYTEAGMTMQLQRLTDYDGSSDDLDALTDRQRDVVRTAYEMGYYDVPRAATAEEVAAELDLDDSTVSEHLRRAERNVFGSLLST
jgi:DNA-binding CsgD family transcriptional regulator